MKRRRFILSILIGVGGFVIGNGKLLNTRIRTVLAGKVRRFPGRLRPLDHDDISRPAVRE